MRAGGDGIHAAPLITISAPVAKGAIPNPLLYIVCTTATGPVYAIGWYLRETKTLLYLTPIWDSFGSVNPLRIKKATIYSYVKVRLGEGMAPKFADA